MICQALIVILSMLSGCLLSCKGRWQIWGYVVGLISEPFWMYSAWKNQQWGIVLLVLWYTFWYARGIINHRRDK